MYLYEKVKNEIQNKITKGYYKKGDKIPSEIELSNHYNVSRITIRRAVEELELEGILDKRQGRGTFVKEINNFKLQIINLMGFSDFELKQKIQFNRKIVSKNIIKDKKLDDIFNLGKGEKYLKLERIISNNNNTPKFKDVSYFPLSLYKDINEKIKDDVSTFSIMHDEYGINFDNYKKNISIIQDAKLNEELEILPYDPLISIKKKIIDNQKGIVHYSVNYLIASEFSLELDSSHYYKK